MCPKEYYNVEEVGTNVGVGGVSGSVIAFVWIFPPWFLWKQVSLSIK